jgi:hypothetical protein
MDTPGSILEAARGLVGDPEAKAAFAEDPEGFLTARGLDDFTGPELAEALTHVADALPAAEAAQLPDADTLASLAEAPDGPTALFGEVAAVEPLATDGDGTPTGGGPDEVVTQAEEEPDHEGFGEEPDETTLAVEPELEVEEEVDTGDDHLDGHLHGHLEGDLGAHPAADNFDFPD